MPAKLPMTSPPLSGEKGAHFPPPGEDGPQPSGPKYKTRKPAPTAPNPTLMAHRALKGHTSPPRSPGGWRNHSLAGLSSVIVSLVFSLLNLHWLLEPSSRLIYSCCPVLLIFRWTFGCGQISASVANACSVCPIEQQSQRQDHDCGGNTDHYHHKIHPPISLETSDFVEVGCTRRGNSRTGRERDHGVRLEPRC
jgi:hypothetical protein